MDSYNKEFCVTAALIVSDERGDGVLFVERSSELILMARLSHMTEP